MEESSVDDLGESRCLFCNECVEIGIDNVQKNVQNDLHKHVNYRQERGSEKEVLKNQLSIFFMLRKVLGISKTFLETLLIDCGNPTEWSIKLCRLCQRLFKEAEHLWDRMSQLQRDYEKVTYEIKDTLISSISPKEADFLKETTENTGKTVPQKKIKSSQIVEGIRTHFFIDLQDKSDDDKHDDDEIQIPQLVAAGMEAKGGVGTRSVKSIWNNSGIPYLSFAIFEEKIKKLLATSIAVRNCEDNKVNKSVLPLLSNHDTRIEPEPTMTSSGTNFMESQEKNRENISSTSENKISIKQSSSSRSCEHNATTLNSSIAQSSIQNSEPEDQLVIKVVSPETIMEPEDDDDDDNDAVPHVLEIKHVYQEDLVINDVIMDCESIDPLSSGDVNDKADISITSNNQNADTNIFKSKKPRSKRASKFDSLKIKPVRRKSNLFECPKCLATFDERLGCQFHILRDHYDEKLPYHCHICIEKFAVYVSLREHVVSVHGSKGTPYDDNFTSEPCELQISQQGKGPCIADKQKAPTFNCPVIKCSEQFTFKHALQKHSREVHGKQLFKLIKMNKEKRNDEPPGLECEICAKRNIDYRAPTMDILEIHYKKVHNELVNVKTTIEGKIVHQRREPSSSMQLTSASSSSMKCTDCGKELPNSAAMAQHIKHPDHKCAHCQKHFLFEADLRQHLEVDHNNRDRGLNCPYCAKTFTAQIVFEKHIENHQSFDVHECEVCHVKITGHATLTRHIARAHPEYNQIQVHHENPEILGL